MCSHILRINNDEGVKSPPKRWWYLPVSSTIILRRWFWALGSSLGVENASNLFTKVTAKNIMRHMLYLIVICLASHLLPHLLKKIQIQQEKLLFSGDQPNCGVYGPIDIRYSWQQLNSVCSSQSGWKFDIMAHQKYVNETSWRDTELHTSLPNTSGQGVWMVCFGGSIYLLTFGCLEA